MGGRKNRSGGCGGNGEEGVVVMARRVWCRRLGVSLRPRTVCSCICQQCAYYTCLIHLPTTLDYYTCLLQLLTTHA